MVWDPATRPLLTRHTSTACLPTSEEIVIAKGWRTSSHSLAQILIEPCSTPATSSSS